MYRLNSQVFEILRAEVQNCSGKDDVSKIEQEIVLKPLKRLLSQEGSPLSLDELREKVINTYPQFSEEALIAAAEANTPPGCGCGCLNLRSLVTGYWSLLRLDLPSEENLCYIR